MVNNPTIKYFQTEQGTQLLSVFKSLVETVKSLETFLHSAIPELIEDTYSESATTVPVKKAKRKRDPDAPKQPMSSYFLFAQANRAQLKEAEPNLSPSELLAKLGQIWRELSAQEKEPFIIQGKELMELHKIEKKEYLASKLHNSPEKSADADVDELPVGADSDEENDDLDSSNSGSEKDDEDDEPSDSVSPVLAQKSAPFKVIPPYGQKTLPSSNSKKSIKYSKENATVAVPSKKKLKSSNGKKIKAD